MIGRVLFRLGPWLFIASIAWYLGINTLIERLNKASIAQAERAHKGKQDIEIRGVTTVQFRAEDDLKMQPQLKIIFDSSALRATISHISLGMIVDAKIVNGVLDVTFPISEKSDKALGKMSRYENRRVEIRLPSFVNKVGISGIGDVELTGQFQSPSAELAFEIFDSIPEVKVESLVINHLKLSINSLKPWEEADYTEDLILGESNVINNLGVIMSIGKILISSNELPQHIQLELGDKVMINGPSTFFRTAQFKVRPNLAPP
jgi:hypothetical protein